MLVKIRFAEREGASKVQLIECDQVYQTRWPSRIEMFFYKDDRLVKRAEFIYNDVREDSVDVFFMENGQTVDRIHLNNETVPEEAPGR